MGGEVGKLVFQGDSLIRQLVVGVVAILSGNYRSGGINAYTPLEYWAHCECVHQWQCFQSPVNHRIGRASPPQFTICPKWTRDHLVVSRQPSLGNEQEVVVANAEALHHSEEERFPSAVQNFESTLRALKKGGELIPMTVHWPSPNKPNKFLRTQGPEAVQRYNAQLRKWTARNNVWLLETYAYTEGEYSRDGVHYDDKNIGLGQILLNYIARLRQQGRLAAQPEHNTGDNSTYAIGDPAALGVKVFIGPHPPPQKN